MTASEQAPHPVMRMLAAGIPLTLLIDVFASSRRPQSRDVLKDEPADLGWLRHTPAA